ncbi:MAG: hypothetical protein AAF488_07065 [Planctomycetota bacterium]
MKRVPFVVALWLANAGVLVISVACLPRRAHYVFENTIEFYVNSRANWDVAWGITAGAALISIAIYLVLESCGLFGARSAAEGASETGRIETRREAGSA